MYIIFYGTYLCLYHKSLKPRAFSFSLSHRRTWVRRIIWPPTHILTNHISEILIAVLWFVKRCAFPSYDRTHVQRRKNRWHWLEFRQKLIVKWTCHSLIFFLIFCRSLKMVIPSPPVIWKMPWIMLESNCLCTEWGSCWMTWKPKAKHVIKKEYLRKFSEK